MGFVAPLTDNVHGGKSGHGPLCAYNSHDACSTTKHYTQKRMIVSPCWVTLASLLFLGSRGLVQAEIRGIVWMFGSRNCVIYCVKWLVCLCVEAGQLNPWILRSRETFLGREQNCTSTTYKKEDPIFWVFSALSWGAMLSQLYDLCILTVCVSLLCAVCTFLGITPQGRTILGKRRRKETRDSDSCDITTQLPAERRRYLYEPDWERGTETCVEGGFSWVAGKVGSFVCWYLAQYYGRAQQCSLGSVGVAWNAKGRRWNCENDSVNFKAIGR